MGRAHADNTIAAVNHADTAADAARLGRTCSFSADTPVATPNGDKPIGDLAVGDQVLAFDEATSTTGSYTVTATWAHTDPLIITLIIGGEHIETTPEHPFFVEGRGWVAAEGLAVGDPIRWADGAIGTVQGIAVEQRSQVMYNLTVATAHTFSVGDGQWLLYIPTAQRHIGIPNTAVILCIE